MPTVKLPGMLIRRLHGRGLRSWHLHVMSLGAVGLCIVLWIRAKTVGEDERGNAERRALFVGLWPPLLWLIGDSIAREERTWSAAVRARWPSRRTSVKRPL